MRLPTVTRQKTGVRHLWDLNSSSLSATVYDWASTLGNIRGDVSAPTQAFPLTPNTSLSVLTRDPVTPGFYTVQSTIISAGEWSWVPYWPDQTTYWGKSAGINSTGSQPIELTPISRTSTSLEVFTVTVPEPQCLLQPIKVHTNGFLMSGTIPAARANGKLYGFHSVGTITLTAWLITTGGTKWQVPAGATVNFRYSVRRYAGPDTPDDSFDDDGATFLQGADTCTVSNSFSAGYYHIAVHSVSVQFNNITIPPLAVYFSAGTLHNITGTGAAVLPVINESITAATYMLERVRVTAASMLVANRSSALAKAGQLYGCRTGGEYNFFTSMTQAIIMGLAGASGTGYYGPLDKGGYTFLEPPASIEEFTDNCVNYLGINHPVANLGKLSIAHVLYATWPHDSLTVSTTLLAVRHDIHVEFLSNSQLADLSITADPLSDYTDATIVLCAGSYFFENPTHLSQVWGWIKRTASLALKAGATAAARVALEHGTTALAALLI